MDTDPTSDALNEIAGQLGNALVGLSVSQAHLRAKAERIAELEARIEELTAVPDDTDA